jgi:LytR cell envelope-related transcriptional attenuator
MNERVPDSSGLPLRAMVMVLLFLGVIFLLLGWQALGSSGSSDEDSASPLSSVSTTTTTGPTSTSGKPAAANQAEVRVYNISGKEGVAKQTSEQLKAAGFKVTAVENLQVSDVPTTTVYYSDAEGEKATAEAVGQKLDAPVEQRIPALAGQGPGVIVLVTG